MPASISFLLALMVPEGGPFAIPNGYYFITLKAAIILIASHHYCYMATLKALPGAKSSLCWFSASSGSKEERAAAAIGPVQPPCWILLPGSLSCHCFPWSATPPRCHVIRGSRVRAISPACNGKGSRYRAGGYGAVGCCSCSRRLQQ